MSTIFRRPHRAIAEVVSDGQQLGSAGNTGALESLAGRPRPGWARPTRDLRELTEGDGKVIAFRPRAAALRSRSRVELRNKRDESPVDDRQEGAYSTDRDDDYHHRMRVNFVALLVIILVVASGSWIFDTLALTAGRL